MDELKAAVDSLAAGGFTNHADAFAKATALFDPNSTNAKVMVMFTDGKTTAGPDPNPDFVITSILMPTKGIASMIDATTLKWTIDKLGTKTLTIPAHFSTSCRDVLVKCVKFILPENLDVSGSSTTAICNTRNFKARVFAHNIDSDFYCCNNVTFRHATSL